MGVVSKTANIRYEGGPRQRMKRGGRRASQALCWPCSPDISSSEIIPAASDTGIPVIADLVFPIAAFAEPVPASVAVTSIRMMYLACL